MAVVHSESSEIGPEDRAACRGSSERVSCPDPCHEDGFEYANYDSGLPPFKISTISAFADNATATSRAETRVRGGRRW
jgi:hypothetical protein